jgi:hypothetical protein
LLLLFVNTTALARLPTLLKLIPAPAFTVKLPAPLLPIVNAPVPFTVPVVPLVPVVLNVRLPGVVTALSNVIVPPRVWKTHAPEGFTPVTAPSVTIVPVCNTSPIVNTPLVVIVFNSPLDKPKLEPVVPAPNAIMRPIVLDVNITAPLPPVIVPPANTMSSAVKLIAFALPSFVITPAVLVNVPVPAFSVRPPTPIIVLVFVIPTLVKLTLPVLPAVTA